MKITQITVPSKILNMPKIVKQISYSLVLCGRAQNVTAAYE